MLQKPPPLTASDSWLERGLEHIALNRKPVLGRAIIHPDFFFLTTEFIHWMCYMGSLCARVLTPMVGQLKTVSVLNLKIRVEIEEVETCAKNTGLQALQKYSAMIEWFFTL